MKICKDGRIWGQNNKQSGLHLGICSLKKEKSGKLKKHWWSNKGKHIWNKFPHPRGMLGKIPWNKGKPFLQKENHPLWKGGISKTKEYYRPYKQRYKYLKKGGGELSIKTIQLVYEDNIKKFGTLTCIYCLKQIEFSKDTLEHKQPLSRGGTNEYNNLAIACKGCNSKKKDKTVEEFINQGGRNERKNHA